MFYDPMIAKLITWAPTREQAIDEQIAALDRFRIEGLGHNIDFLSALMQHPRFREGALTTGFIAEEYPEGFAGAATSDAQIRRLVAVAARIASVEAARGFTISGRLGDDRIEPRTEWIARVGGEELPVSLEGDAVTVAGQTITVDAPWRPGDALVEAMFDGEPLSVQVARRRSGWRLTARGGSHDIQLLSPRVAELARHMIEKVPPDTSKLLLCPMPGLLTQLHVGVGDKVEAGQPLAVVEAMKMENILRAEKAGVVSAVNHQPGESLAVDAAILEFE